MGQLQCCPGVGGCESTGTALFYDMDANQPPRKHHGSVARRMTLTSQNQMGNVDQSMVSYQSEFSHTREMPTSIMIVNEQDRQKQMDLLRSASVLNFSADAYAKKDGALTTSQKQWRMQSMPELRGQLGGKSGNSSLLLPETTGELAVAPAGPLLTQSLPKDDIIGAQN